MRVKFENKKTSVVFWSVFLSTLLLWGCLNRDNPWDPLNYSGPDVPLTREEKIKILRANLDSLLMPIHNIHNKYLNSDSLESYIEGWNTRSQTVNNNINLENSASLVKNQQIDSANLLLCETGNIQLKILLDPYSLMLDYHDLRQEDTAYYLWPEDTALVSETREVLDSTLEGDTLLANSYKDSLFNFLSQLRLSAELLFLTVDSTRSIWVNYNSTEGLVYNENIERLNQSFVTYNDSISAITNFDCATTVSSSEELISKLDSIKPGDVVNISEGDYQVELFLEKSGTLDSPIVINGDPLGRTKLGIKSNSALIIDGAKHIHFKNLVFGGTGATGAVVQNGSDSILFENCSFASNDIGLELDNSNLIVINSKFYDNSFSGIKVTNSTGKACQVYFDNLLFVRNGYSGLEGGQVEGIIARSTFSNNQRDGVILYPPDGKLHFMNNNFAENGYEGFAYSPEFLDTSRVLFTGNNFYKADGFQLLDSLVNKEENYNLNPYFKNIGQLEYRIGPESELYLYSSDNNRIGYWYLY